MVAFIACCSTSQTSMKVSRVLFMKHKDGYMIPAFIQVNSYDSNLVSIVQKLNVSEQYIWFFSKTLKVCAATSESMRIMGVRLMIRSC